LAGVELPSIKSLKEIGRKGSKLKFTKILN
jgi:hypothetical protein